MFVDLFLGMGFLHNAGKVVVVGTVGDRGAQAVGCGSVRGPKHVRDAFGARVPRLLGDTASPR